MQLDYYIESQGVRQTDLARAINVKPQLIYQWVHNRRPVPVERCVAIERATGGAVTRRDLRPEIGGRFGRSLRMTMPHGLTA